MKKPIFISYKRIDKERVLVIKDFIESHTGLYCWIDLDGIESDAQFEDVIIDAIDNCEVFLYLYSIEHTKITDYENDWTIRELDFAQEEKKRIVFINLDNTPLTKKFKFRYRNKQQVDAQDKSRLEKLISDIKKWFKIGSEISEPIKVDVTKVVQTEYAQYIKVPVFQIRNSKIINKQITMILSDNREFYIGNLEAESENIDWYAQKPITSVQSTSPNMKMSTATTVAGVLTMAGIAYAVYNLRKKHIPKEKVEKLQTNNSTNSNVINLEPSLICELLNKSGKLIYDIPTNEELKGVKIQAKKSCIVLRIKDNTDINRVLHPL